jgi:hypothetical protein
VRVRGADDDCVGADEGDAGVLVLALLVGLDVVFPLDVGAVDVYLRAGQRDDAAVRLLQRHLAADLRHLCRGDDAASGQQERGCEGLE